MTNSKPQTKTELAYWLALIRAPKLGPALFLKLLEIFPKLSDLFNLSWQALIDLKMEPGLAAYLQKPDWRGVEKDLHWAQQAANKIITWQDATYPTLLREIISAPPVLYVQGDAEILSLPQLAIVGSRNPTALGSECALEFAKLLAASGLTITSGLALGIDAAAHRGALAAKGLTIGVTGTGLDRIYPARHTELARQIIEQGGALISEFPPGTLAKAENFPRRNRLISGLSVGVLVVEAALKSGSLITAKYALEQSREVFAIPGSIHNPLARGCHALLRQGAKLVETATDILEELGALLQAVTASATPNSTADAKQKALDLPPLAGDYARILACIGYESTPVDMLIERSGLPAETVSSLLMVLELQGYVAAVAGGYITDIKSKKKL
jgi:DNA processing protein